MKFTDGYWLMRPGVSAHHAVSVADAVVTDDRLTLYAPVGRVAHRGDTLNGPLLTVECWSPAEGVIGVRTTHHGGRAPGGPSSRSARRRDPRPGLCARDPSSNSPPASCR